MSIPLWRSRTGLRYYLFHGIALSLLLVALALGACVCIARCIATRWDSIR